MGSTGSGAAASAAIMPLGLGVLAVVHALRLGFHIDDELGQLVKADRRHVHWVFRPQVQVQLAQRAPRFKDSDSPDTLPVCEVLDVPSRGLFCTD